MIDKNEFAARPARILVDSYNFKMPSIAFMLIMAKLLVALVFFVAFLLNTAQKAEAADKLAWFWCAAHSTESENPRNFYSNVFRANINHKSRYERAFRSVVSTRVLKATMVGSVSCTFNEIRGEARREQNDYALDRDLRQEGTMEFLDWSY